MTPVELLKTTVKSQRQTQEWQATAALVTASVTGSLIIALYVFAIAHALNTHRQSTNTVEKAAIYAAGRLAEISVAHPSFGQVGLIDHGNGRILANRKRKASQRVIGINTLMATARINSIIASNANNRTLSELVKKDVALAKTVEGDLTRTLYEAVEQRASNAPSQTADRFKTLESAEEEEEIYSIVQDVTRLLAEDVRTRETALVDVKITLGSLRSASATSLIQAPHQDRGREFVKDGYYRARVPVPMPDGGQITFVPLLSETKLVETNLFEKTAKSLAPSAVLIEAVYESALTSGQEGGEIVTKKACAAIGGAPVEPANSAFVFRFPHGKPPTFTSINDVLEFRDWTGQGEWQQVVGTEVPGKGSLAPTIEPVLPGMAPGEALAVALYHWLKQAGPSVDPHKVEVLFSYRWDLIPFQVPVRDQSSPINSCLLSDTGAREYSLLNQTGPDGLGQRGISRCFEIAGFGTARDKIQPQSALPLVVDWQGKCLIAGRSTYDKALVRDFLSAVYDTNLAAIESYESARQMLVRAKGVLSELDQKMFIERQELNSVVGRMNRLRSELPSAPDEASLQASLTTAQQKEKMRQFKLAKSRLDTLKLLLIADQSQRSRYRKLQEIALRTQDNANLAAVSTFDLSSHAYQLLRDGLYRVTFPVEGFLIGRRLLFFPRAVPISESEFFEATESPPDSGPVKEMENDASLAGEKKKRLTPLWTGQDMSVLREAAEEKARESGILIEGRPLTSFLASSLLIRSWQPLTFVIESRSLMAEKDENIMGPHNEADRKKNKSRQQLISAFGDYPYSGLRLPQGQLLYYARNAFVTGNEPVVSWSVVARDLMASRTEGNMGEPLHPQESDFLAGGKDRPGLAAEFQIRTPLPVPGDLYTGSVITNPNTQHKTPQIPPVPADML